MNLLPKTHEEFSQADYWNTFFKKRGKKAFEWYGEYAELCEIIQKYIKMKDNILVVGCGNSTLSMSLYDVGYRNINNIDISRIVIKQMNDINKTTRPDLSYEQMDATQMTYPDDKFNVVLDKGTLDALMPDTKAETVATIDKYFKEVSRVLCNNGRYICVTLLQEHILRKLLSYFTTAGFMFRITRCHEAETKARMEEGSSIPVFVVTATKFTKLPRMVLEIALVNGPPERFSSTEDMISAVLSAQQSALVCNSLRKRSVTDVGEVSLDLHRPGDKYPRYTVYVLDRPCTRVKSYAAFIVPQGKETDWLFSTKEGRQQVLKSAERDRLAIVTLQREHKFENWDTVKNELEDCIRNLAPSDLGGKADIPFLSLGTDVGIRVIRHRGTSEMSGPFVVEEVESDGHDYRRLIFLNNPYMIQSEARLKLVKSRRGKSEKVVEPGFPVCRHHIYMTAGVCSSIEVKKQQEILVVGLGGGGLCLFLRYCFSKVKITAVEIDEVMLKIATDHFDLTLDNRLNVVIMDGIQFIKDSAKCGRKYNAILFDVDSKDNTLGMSGPPKEFLDTSVLKDVIACLAENGFFILNLVSRDQILKEKVKSELRSIFKMVAYNRIEDEVNEVILCSANVIDATEWKARLKAGLRTVVKSICEGAKKSITDGDVFDVSSLFETLTIDP